jgi:hypothetical protein
MILEGPPVRPDGQPLSGDNVEAILNRKSASFGR